MRLRPRFHSIPVLLSALLLVSCVSDVRRDSVGSPALDRFKVHCEIVRNYEKAFCEERIDYGSFYNDSAIIVGVSFGPMDTLTVGQNQQSHQRAWERYDFKIHGPIRFSPGVDPTTLEIDGSVRMHIELEVTSAATGRSVVLPVYEEYDFDAARKIKRLVYYGDMTAAFQSIDEEVAD